MTYATQLGILGGGQLAQMLAMAALPLGIRCHVYEPTADAPARFVADHHQSSYTQNATLKIFAERVDVITYEFENVPAHAADFLAHIKPIHPQPKALAICQDRLFEKQFVTEQGFMTAPFAAVDPTKGVSPSIEKTGLPSLAKTRRMGYDGKGQQRIHSLTEAYQMMVDLAGQELILEGIVNFTRELSIIAVRDQHGHTVRYPLIENHHHQGILRLSLAPATNVHPLIEAQADAMAQLLTNALDYVGVLTIECFEVMTPNGPTLLINELAPRVHNSGHWSIEGAITSQFENHVRAVCGLPIGPTTPRGMSAMINLISDIPSPADIPQGVFVHLYHKAPRPGRKVGHLTIVARDMATLMRKIEECRGLPGVWLPPVR
jgi:5-(carboxyamino)imidazole ribonucleotide synthase